MAGNSKADIVFVLDASDSMSPCIEGVRRHLGDFLEVFRGDANTTWDVRFDIIAHRIGGGVYSIESIHEPGLWQAFYGDAPCRFFTTNVDEARGFLSRVVTTGDESPFVALDFALDAPWRDRSSVRRIVVFFTDEPHETGVQPEPEMAKFAELKKKIEDLKVNLFLVTPDSEGFEKLAAVDRADWEQVPGGDGLASVDLGRLLENIAKSISRSQTPIGTEPPVTRGLYGQEGWGTGEFVEEGDRT